MVMGTHFVLTGSYDTVAILASIPPGFLVSNLLLLNQFPDLEADASINRYHIPIAFGRRASAWVYAAFAIATYVWIIACWALGLFPASTLIALIPLPLATYYCQRGDPKRRQYQEAGTLSRAERDLHPGNSLVTRHRLYDRVAEAALSRW